MNPPFSLQETSLLPPTMMGALFGMLDDKCSISVTEPDGTIIYVNRCFCRISGYRIEELLGKNHRVVKSGFHTRAFYEQMWKEISEGRTWSGELCNLRKDGSLYWLDALISPIFGADGRITHFIALRLEANVRSLGLDQMLIGARKNDITPLADGIAHDINNYLTLLTLGVEEAAELKPFNRGLLMQAVSDIAALTKGLRDLCQGRVTAPSSFVLADTIRYVLRLVSLHQSSSGGMPALELDIQAIESVSVQGNEAELASVLMNLLINAKEALEDRPDGRIQIKASLSHSMLQILVRDNGPGIPPERAKRVFQGGGSTKGAQRGQGLFMSRRTLLAHGGDLSLLQNEGGATFALTLPSY